MSILSKEIQTGGYTGTDAEIALAFTGLDIEHRDETLYTWSSLVPKLMGLGVPFSEVVSIRDTLTMLPNGGEMLCRMIDAGVNLSHDAIRHILNEIRRGQPPEVQSLIDVIKSCGITMRPIWQKIGLPASPTPTQVAEAKAEIARDKWIKEVTDELLHPQSTNPNGGKAKTIEALKSEIAEKPAQAFADVMQIVASDSIE